MYAQNRLSESKFIQQTPSSFRSSISDSPFCAKDHLEADIIMKGYRHKSGCKCKICSKTAWNKGLTKKEHPNLSGGRLGIPCPKELKKKISEATKGIKKPTLLGDNNPSKRRVVRDKISKSLKKRYKNQDGNFKGKHHNEKTKLRLRKINLGKKLSNETISKLRNARLKQVFPFKDTSIEKAMQKALIKQDITFRTHEPIIGQPDIFIEPNICIFCDGDYWHNREDYKKRDKYVNQKLKEKGYIILRFWEHQINRNIDGCLELIKNVI